MMDLIAHIAESLKEARKKKGLSQRVLSSKTGLPQSHISKIESGAVDLQVSSLIALSRVLDLELMLVPRELVLTVRAFEKGLGKEEQVPLYRLEEDASD